MSRIRIALAALTAALVTGVGVAAAAAHASKLNAFVSDPAKIGLKQNGKTVKTPKAIHDFHLIGPGINKVITTVPFKGTKTVIVKLKKGTYTYQCDPHAARGMKGKFGVK